MRKRFVSKFLIAVTACALLLTLTALGDILKQYREESVLYDQLEKIAFKDVAPGVTGSTGATGATGESEKQGIDHAALSALNADYAAWIRVEGTKISYPVVRSDTPQYYLRRDFYGSRSVGGTVFVDSANGRDFTDTNTMLFGHHMRDGSMFSPLKKFLNRDFFNANRFVWIDTPGRTLTYEIFAVYETGASLVPYSPGNLTDEQLTPLLDRINALAKHKRETEVNLKSRILTLSTCGYSVRNARIIVHAVLLTDTAAIPGS